MSSHLDLGQDFRSDGKVFTAMWETGVQEDLPWVRKIPPGSGRSPGEGKSYPLQYSCLKNSMNRGTWQVIVHGITKSCT